MQHAVLSNGLEIFIFENHRSPIFSFNIFYRVGSMDERPGITGASHFVEHLKFRGSEKIKGADIDRHVKRHGGILNGFTNEDVTVYFMALPTSEIEYPMIVESDLMTSASFKIDDFENERKIIMEERRLQIEDSPVGALFEAMKSSAFWTHPYRYPVIGWMSDIENVSRETIYDYYRANYRPGNAFIIVCGDVDPARTIHLIEKHFSKIANNVPKIPQNVIQEPKQDGIRRIVLHKSAELPVIMMGFHATNLKDPNVYPLIVAEKILSGGESSRIYRNIVHEKRLAVTAGSVFDYITRDPGLFIFYAQASPDVDPKILEESLWAEADGICGDLVSMEELEKAKNTIEADFIYRREQVIAESIWRGNYHLAGNMELYDSFVEKIREVTADSVYESCKQILTRENATVAELVPTKPGGGNGKFETPPSLKWNTFFYQQASGNQEDIQPDGLRYWDDADKFELENGIKVIAYHRDDLPIFQVGMLVNSGAVYDPPQKGGLSSLVANLLRAGTGSRSSKDIAEEVDNVGGEFSISLQRENLVIGMRFLSRYRRIALDILSDCLIYPSFLEDELQRYKDLQCGEMMSEEDDIWSLTAREFNRRIYNGTPYSHPILGNFKAVDSITPDDVHEFHNRFFGSMNTLITVVGDFNRDEIKKELNLYFCKMPAGERMTPPEIRSDGLVKPGISTYKKDLSQASIALGGYLFPRKSDDYFPFLALDHIFGYGSLTSRIGEKIRMEKGLAYYVASGFLNLSRTGNWRLLMQTKTENAKEAIQLARDEMRKMREEPVTDEELDDFKSNFTGRSSLEFESNRGIAQKLLTIAYHDLGDDYLANYFRKIRSVTKEQIMDVARKYLDPDALHILIVGDESFKDFKL